MVDPLPPCPPRLSCVSSRSDAFFLHRVDPISVPEDPDAAFRRLRTLLAETERIQVVAETDTYIHAVCRTRLGFVDDLECQLCVSQGVIHVRSGSRVGIYDFGVNRRRVERFRRRLLEEAGSLST